MMPSCVCAWSVPGLLHLQFCFHIYFHAVSLWPNKSNNNKRTEKIKLCHNSRLQTNFNHQAHHQGRTVALWLALSWRKLQTSQNFYSRWRVTHGLCVCLNVYLGLSKAPWLLLLCSGSWRNWSLSQVCCCEGGVTMLPISLMSMAWGLNRQPSCCKVPVLTTDGTCLRK